MSWLIPFYPAFPQRLWFWVYAMGERLPIRNLGLNDGSHAFNALWMGSSAQCGVGLTPINQLLTARVLTGESTNFVRAAARSF